MKRIVTAFLFLLLMTFVVGGSSLAQQRSIKTRPVPTVQATPLAPIPFVSDFQKSSRMEPLALTSYSETYTKDTTNGNWWVYMPVYPLVVDDEGSDSLNYFHTDANGVVMKNADTIYDAIHQRLLNGDNTITDTTISDTMFYRLMGLRVSTPAAFKANSTRYLDSVQLTILPYSLSDRDTLMVRAVPIVDDTFRYTNGEIAGVWPIPTATSVGRKAGTGLIAQAPLKASNLTLGEVQTVTANFKHASLGTRTQYALIVYTTGPDFIKDSIGYVLDANAQPGVQNPDIDTDGMMGSVLDPVSNTGIPMRTYLGYADAGNIIFHFRSSTGADQPEPYPIASFPNFFYVFGPFGQDANTFFYGNLAWTSFMSGTAVSGVDNNAPNVTALNDNMPNPVANRTQFSFNLEKNTPVSLKLYNALGEELSTLASGVQGAGPHTIDFDASTLANGTYFYKLQAGSYSATRTMVVTK